MNNDPLTQLSTLLPCVIKLAYTAGNKIMQIRGRANYDIDRKSDNSPVTEADYAAHNIIKEGLNSLPQGWPILSEEDPDMTYETRKKWETYWLIDPLDGTRDFIAGRETFSVNIALIHKHVSVLGVIQLPVTGECFSAGMDHGAWKQLPKQNAVAIHTRKFSGHIPVVTVSGSRRNDLLQQCLANIGEHELIYIGSSIKSCRVAEGTVDFYPCLGPTSEWDTAAAQCIVEQAGGRLTNTQGKPLSYNKRETLINPWFVACGDPQHDCLKYIPEKTEV